MFQKFSYLLLVSLFAVVSCQTTNSKISRVDRDRGQVTLYSTKASPTAMPSPKSNRSIKKTITALNNEVKKNPKNKQAYLDLAKLHLLREEFKSAKKYASKALEQDLKGIEAKKILAKVAYRNKNYNLASIIINNIGGRESKDSEIVNLLALLAVQKSKTSQARALFNRAIELNSRDLAARMNLGILLMNHHQVKQAGVEFERVLRLFPENLDAIMYSAIVDTAAGSYEKAENKFEKVLDESPKNPIALYNSAVMYNRMDKKDKALVNLRKFLKTPMAKRSSVDGVFALIDEIKDAKAREGKSPITDEEVQALAKDIEDESPEDDILGSVGGEPEQVTPEEGEIQDLESEIFDAH